jgi:hypothetical protein
MLTPLVNQVRDRRDFAHQARRFRVVLENFTLNVELLFAGSPLRPKVDPVALAAAFTRWHESFEQARQEDSADRQDLVVCAAGLMLKQLLQARPLRSLENAGTVQLGDAKTSWPEGYVYTNFCVSMAKAVMEDLHMNKPVNQALADDPAFWNSFRENVAENTSTAAGFFDLLFDIKPNWDGPDIPAFRNAVRANRLLPAS